MSETHEIRALSIIPKSVSELMTLAEMLSKSELLPKALRGKVADVAMTIMAGQEMGFAPGASLRNLNIIEGKPVLSASGKVALVKSSGLCKYFDCIEETDERVTYETLRVGATKPRRATWTKQRAKDAGLNTKDNWRLYGKQMLDARAKSELCENTYEDVLAGIATQELMFAVSDADHVARDSGVADAIDAEIVSTEVTLPDVFDAIEQTTTEDECKALVAKGGALSAEMAKLTAEQRKIANERYGAQLKKVRQAEKQEGAA